MWYTMEHIIKNTERLSFLIDKTTKKTIERDARSRGVSLADVSREMIRFGLDRKLGMKQVSPVCQ